MRGPYRKRCVQKPPYLKNFKPSGTPRRLLKKIDLTLDEYEAIRLADYLKLEHLEASEKMKISRPTFTRLIERARQKIALAIIDGKELVIRGGNIELVNTIYVCQNCGKIITRPFSETYNDCTDCGSSNIENKGLQFLDKNR